MTRESIKAKIAALLAKAEGTDNPHEADTFMRKVNELLERHQMEMHEIRAAMGDQDPMGKQRGETNIYASMLWARDLGGALAAFYGCKYVYWRQNNNFNYEVIGRDSARMTFELMMPFVISQVRVQAKVLVAHGMTKSIAEREVGHALRVRLYRMAAAANEHRNELVGKGLIPVSDLDAAMAEFYPEVKKAKASKAKYGYTAQELAEKISVNVQAEHRKQEKLA